MSDEFPVDFASTVGRVRKFIPDLIQLSNPADSTAEKSYIFSDDEIQAFIDDEVVDADNPKPWQLRRAAAWAMIAIANSENLILKKLITQDQQTDGPSVAKAMLASADMLLKRADVEEANANVDAVENLIAVFPTHDIREEHLYSIRPLL